MPVKRYKVEQLVTQRFGELGLKLLTRQYQRVDIDGVTDEIPDDKYRVLLKNLEGALVLFVGGKDSTAFCEKLASLMDGD